MRFAPTFCATEMSVAMRADGMPALSNSLATADPQRVQVPQAEVMRAASISSDLISPAISRPIRTADS
jgi:hypothetical protein